MTPTARRYTDMWRGLDAVGAPQPKEWMHVCVPLPDAGWLLVNFSMAREDVAGRLVTRARLLALAHAGGWLAHAETVAAEVTRTPLRLRFGPAELRQTDGGLRLVIDAPELRADLALALVHPPSLPTAVTWEGGSRLDWSVSPRVLASGIVEVRGRRMRLHEVPGYHDHNWGRFPWGGGLSWVWGFVNAPSHDEPWSVVSFRVEDVLRGRILTQSVLVWSDEGLVRVFRGREVELARDGVLEDVRPFTVPGIANVLLPPVDRSLPAVVRVDAVGAGDRLRLAFGATHHARIALPSDVSPLAMTTIHELGGVARVEGVVGGRTCVCEAPGMMELVHG